MSEPTKACIVMLKFEHKVWKIIKYPLKFIEVCINFILQFVNWCIVGSLLRLFGIPLTVYFSWKLRSFLQLYSMNADPIIGFVYIVLIAFSFVGFIASWAEMPDNQKRIVMGD
jgi:hypothetical protein